MPGKMSENSQPFGVTFLYDPVTGEVFTAKEARKSPKTGRRPRVAYFLDYLYGSAMKGRAIFRKRLQNGEYQFMCTLKEFNVAGWNGYEMVLDLEQKRREIRNERYG